jgi:preprotein translocase subunit SecG
VLAQILVSLAGIMIMTTVAYYISWSKRQDKPASKAPTPPAQAPAAPAE